METKDISIQTIEQAEQLLKLNMPISVVAQILKVPVKQIERLACRSTTSK